MSTSSHNIEELLGNARWMQRFAHTLCQDGDDLVQDAWMAALTSGAPRREEERAWLATVMRNAFRMRLRGSKRRTLREQDAPASEQAPAPDLLTQRVLVQRRLCDHLLQLTEAQREVILLHFYEGMSAVEIARQLGIPATTVRSRLDRALEVLRGALDRESDGDRQAWRLALVPLLEPFVPPIAVPHAALGVVAMSAKTKIAMLLALLLLLGGAVTIARLGKTSDTAVDEPAVSSDHQKRIASLRQGRKQRSAIAPPAATCPLRGTVRSAQGGAALPHARIWSSADPKSTHTSDANGHFVIEASPRGELALGVSAEGHASDLHVVDNRCAADLLLLLEPGGILVQGTVHDVGGGPVAQASVGLALVRAGQNASGLLPARSDDDGKYSLRVRVGAYGLGVTHPAYVATNEFLAVGGSRAIVRDIVLLPAGGLGGRVVEAASGEAVAGARIEVVGEQAGVGMTQLVHSDASGRFVVAGLPPGRTRLRVRAQGLRASFEIELGLAEERFDIEIKLERALTLAGYVVQKGTSNPVGGATVMAMDPVSQDMITSEETTSDDGYFQLHGVAAGTYMLMAQAADHLTEMNLNAVTITGDRDDLLIELPSGRRIVGQVQPPGPARIMIDSVEVDLAYIPTLSMLQLSDIRADAQGRFELKGMPAIPLRIRASSDDGQAGETEIAANASDAIVTLQDKPSIAGQLVDDAGHPLVGAWVSLDGVPAMLGGMRQKSGMGSRSDEQGHFRLIGLEPGSYQVSAHDDGGERQLIERVSWTGGTQPPSADDNELGAVELSEHGIADLRVRVAQVDRGINGIVLDEAGGPVADAWVQAQPRGAPIEVAVRSVLTDAAGRFVLADLRAPSYELTAKMATGEAMGASKLVEVGEQASLVVQNLVEVTLDIKGTGKTEICQLRLHGASDIEMHRPARAATIRVRPGEHIIEVECESGYARLEQHFEGGIIAVDLQPWASLSGQIADSHGRALVGMRVFAVPDDSDSSPSSRAALRMFSAASISDENGRVLVQRIPKGPFQLAAISDLTGFAKGGMKGTWEFVAEAGQRIDAGTLVLDSQAPGQSK